MNETLDAIEHIAKDGVVWIKAIAALKTLQSKFKVNPNDRKITVTQFEGLLEITKQINTFLIQLAHSHIKTFETIGSDIESLHNRLKTLEAANKAKPKRRKPRRKT
jgi:hypothetical protein